MTTEARALGLIYVWVIGATQNLSSNADADRLAADAASKVEAGYAAFYREEGGSPQIGVYALRLKTPPTDAEARRYRASEGTGGPTALRSVKGSVVIFAWSNAREDVPDRGCWDVVRRHLEHVDLR